MGDRRLLHSTRAAGVVILFSMVAHLWVIDPVEQGVFHVLGVVITIGGSGIGLLVLGSRYVEMSSPDTGRTHLSFWVGASTIIFLGIGVVSVYMGSEVVTTTELLEVFHVSGSAGLFVGLVMGVLESRGLASAEEAAREAARADALRAERERAGDLNDLLRHYVLNGVAVIDGYATTIGDESPEHADEVNIIRRRAENMAILVQNVRALTVDVGPSPAVREMSVGRSLRRAVDGHDDDRLELALPPESVKIDVAEQFVDGISLLVDTVLDITESGGTVEIDCAVGPETVLVTVSGRPGTLSEPLRESAFDPVTAGVGLQLYLVSELVGEYGTIAVRDPGTDSETVSFEIELARAETSATPERPAAR